MRALKADFGAAYKFLEVPELVHIGLEDRNVARPMVGQDLPDVLVLLGCWGLLRLVWCRTIRSRRRWLGGVGVVGDGSGRRLWRVELHIVGIGNGFVEVAQL